jgi:EF hand
MRVMNHDFKNARLRLQLCAFTTALLLTTVSACAQTSVPPAPTATPPASTPEAAQGLTYNASNIALAFTYIDANKDGKISRDEAAGFRGVAKYFDEADVNKDSFLSREEFENAMNRSKPK